MPSAGPGPPGRPRPAPDGGPPRPAAAGRGMMGRCGPNDERADGATGRDDFVGVANRLPVDEVEQDNGGTTWRPSPGGLVAALEPVMRRKSGAWVGWAGSAGPARDAFDAEGMR